jgi:hypothetical protein
VQFTVAREHVALQIQLPSARRNVQTNEAQKKCPYEHNPRFEGLTEELLRAILACAPQISKKPVTDQHFLEQSDPCTEIRCSTTSKDQLGKRTQPNGQARCHSCVLVPSAVISARKHIIRSLLTGSFESYKTNAPAQNQSVHADSESRCSTFRHHTEPSSIRIDLLMKPSAERDSEALAKLMPLNGLVPHLFRSPTAPMNVGPAQRRLAGNVNHDPVNRKR